MERIARGFIFCVAALLLLSISAAPASSASPRRVCLDPGHGGSDPGAVYAGMNEKDLNLDITKRLEQLLIASGYAVTLTRTGDVRLGNSERAAICNAAGAKVVLSIHLNATSDPAIDYARVFYGKPLKDLEFARTVDANYRISIPGGTCQAGGTGCLPHASVTNFANGTLLKSTAPAALVEALFLSNPAEQELLKEAGQTGTTRRDQIATELRSGLAAWFATH